jgi:S-adenosylmethionine/arginine decarboxylase-like enzyme
MTEIENTYWGYHLILDAAGCNHDLITDGNNITAFANALVKAIDMVPFGEPQVINFGSGNKAGYTLVQLIETSNICAHFVNEYDHMYLDVFSCKPFDQQIVVQVAQEYFQFTGIKVGFLERQAG